MSALFCLLNRRRVHISTTSVTLRACSASRANESECSEAPRAELSWKHARRSLSCLTTALKCRRTASRSCWPSACSCLFMVMPCTLANERISDFLHFPVHSIICCSKAEQRGCSERLRRQSRKTLPSSLLGTKISVGVVAGYSSTSIPSQRSAKPVSKRSPPSSCGAPASSCSPPPCSEAPA